MLVAQEKDYTEIHFKSKLRSYTKVLPKTNEIGVTKELFEELINLLATDVYSESQKIDFTNKLWLAVSNPQKFDYVYKYFSINTIEDWGVKIKFQDPNFEPNPYLEKWTNTGEEFLYFQWAATQILSCIQLMTYGEDGQSAQNALKELKLLNAIKPIPTFKDEYTYDYLARVSSKLKSKDMAILIYNNHYNFTVCKIGDIEKVKALFDKLQWEFIEL